MTILNEPLKVLNIGTSLFSESLVQQDVDVTHLDWSPPRYEDAALLTAIDAVQDQIDIAFANEQAVQTCINAHPVLIDIDLAGNVVPDMGAKTILHAGPPIEWENMAGPLKSAILGAVLYEGQALNLKEAEEKVLLGEFEFDSCHHRQAVGPMTGVISASMPVFVVENKTNGNRVYTNVNEGGEKGLCYGANSSDVLDRLMWIKECLFPVFKFVLSRSGPVDLRYVISQALHMGDECHNRNKAATLLLTCELAPYFLSLDGDKKQLQDVMLFLTGNDDFFLNLSMAASKVAMDAASGIDKSTLVTVMSRNGTDFGIQVSGLKDKWFTAPANLVKGNLFPGYTEDDCNPDIGDGAISEAYGLGGGVPSMSQSVGGSEEPGVHYTELMYNISLGEHLHYTVPSLGFRGVPLGIDIRAVVEQGTLPVINSGIIHKNSGGGLVGVGVVSPPKKCFEAAVLDFYNTFYT